GARGGGAPCGGGGPCLPGRGRGGGGGRGEWALRAGMRGARAALHRLYQEVREYAAPIQLDRCRCRPVELWREAWQDLAALRDARQAELREEIGGGRGGLGGQALTHAGFLEPVGGDADRRGGPAQSGAWVEVRCGPAEVGGQQAVRIAVRDNGPGFAPEQRAKLFEPFYTTKVRGTGLGLAICKRIVEAHGGRIEAGAGPGAEVILTLPRREK